MAKAFVIHLHTGWGPEHYDLMLETGEALATWRLPASPAELAPGDELPATRLGDHRRAYLTYEGPLTGRRGRVRRVDQGQYLLLHADDDTWDLHLAGNLCRGRFALRRCEGRTDEWTLNRLSELD